MVYGRDIARGASQNICAGMGKNYVFGVNAKQSIINLTFEEQVEINEEIIFTLNGCFQCVLICTNYDY